MSFFNFFKVHITLYQSKDTSISMLNFFAYSWGSAGLKTRGSLRHFCAKPAVPIHRTHPFCLFPRATFDACGYARWVHAKNREFPTSAAAIATQPSDAAPLVKCSSCELTLISTSVTRCWNESCPIFREGCPKRSRSSFTQKVFPSQFGQKVAKYLGSYC